MLEKICKLCGKNFNNLRKKTNLKHGVKRIGKKQFSEVKYCSKDCMGKARVGMRFSKEHKKKLSEAKLRNPVKYWLGKNTYEYVKELSRGANSKHWKGDKVGYIALHRWLERRRGKPQKCEHCGIDGLTRHKIHWANKSHKYLRDITDWIRLCVPCHRKYDKPI